jgi:hypothetical protein
VSADDDFDFRSFDVKLMCIREIVAMYEALGFSAKLAIFQS